MNLFDDLVESADVLWKKTEAEGLHCRVCEYRAPVIDPSTRKIIGYYCVAKHHEDCPAVSRQLRSIYAHLDAMMERLF